AAPAGRPGFPGGAPADRETRAARRRARALRSGRARACVEFTMRRMANPAPHPELRLVVGNKNYSSWSMRPWVLARQAGIAFEEVQLKFDESTAGVSVVGVDPYSPTRKVPALLVDGEPVWDSLAICETLAERFPEKK